MFRILFVVLSGGNGTRLRPATYLRQKTLLPAMNGRRIIDFAIESGRVKGIPDIEAKTIVLARYKSDQVINYVKKTNPDVSVFVEPRSLDTGGALLQHWSAIRDYEPDVVVILNGDHLVCLSCIELIVHYFERNSPPLLLVGVHSDETYHDFIDIEFISENLLSKFDQRKSRVAYSGISLLRFDVLKERMDNLNMGTYNMTKDIVEWIYSRYGGDYFLLKNKWDDLGTWKRYLKFLYQELTMF